jgi:hypothetical protein
MRRRRRPKKSNSKTEISFQIYLTKKLETRELILPEYPYTKRHPDIINSTEGGLGEDPVDSFFKELGVIFFRDEEHSLGLLYQPDDGDSTPVFDRAGFLAYKCSGILQWPEMRSLRWPSDRDPGRYRKIVDSYGDDFCWHIWNKPLTVIRISEECIVGS